MQSVLAPCNICIDLMPSIIFSPHYRGGVGPDRLALVWAMERELGQSWQDPGRPSFFLGAFGQAVDLDAQVD